MSVNSTTNKKNIGVLCNPLSGRLKGRTTLVQQYVAEIPVAIYREAANKEEFESVLKEFSSCEVELLVVIAGDGTIQAVLSCLFGQQMFATVPRLAIIPAGTTNMTAKDFKISGRPNKVMKQLVQDFKQGKQSNYITRRVLRVQNGNKLPEYGMFFGTGIIVSGVKYFSTRIRGTGLTGEKASALVFLRFLFSLLKGHSKLAPKGTKTTICIDEEDSRDEICLTIFATSMNRLLFGLRPYWGMEEKPVHVTMVRQSPYSLWRYVWPLLFGRGNRLSEEDGYRSMNLSSLRLGMNADYVIDGEIYSADVAYGELQITANDSISVISFSK